jgi:hypothetical protein
MRQRTVRGSGSERFDDPSVVAGCCQMAGRTTAIDPRISADIYPVAGTRAGPPRDSRALIRPVFYAEPSSFG